MNTSYIAWLLATHGHWGLYNGWGIITNGIRGVKERKGVNETPRRGGYVVFFSAWLASFLYLL